MRRNRKGTRTVYAGVTFRSRLEARHAAFFDLLGWDWTFEPPLDIISYITDFAVGTGKDNAGLIVECKPAISLDDKLFTEAQAKIERSGYEGDALVVGARLFRDSNGRVSPGYSRNRAGAWIPFHLARTSGEWIPSTADGKPSAIHDAWIIYLWREAGNKVQWKAPR